MTTQTETQQTATLPAVNYTSNARNYNGQKEQINRYLAVTRTDRTDYRRWLTLIDCRVYMSYRSDGASPMYASIWIRNPIDPAGERSYSGTGKASGYGYHKASAAIGDAIESAGLKLSQPIDGRGDQAVRDALQAICSALGYDDVCILE